MPVCLAGLCSASVEMCGCVHLQYYSCVLTSTWTSLLLLFFSYHSRYGGISVGGVNSQVRLNEAGIEAVFRDLKGQFSSFQVHNICWHSQSKTCWYQRINRISFKSKEVLYCTKRSKSVHSESSPGVSARLLKEFICSINQGQCLPQTTRVLVFKSVVWKCSQMGHKKNSPPNLSFVIEK